ncbi:hypothetical protein N825_25495 [Skermanella stibiiresistens SB22]|uniref:PRC-barrel domain-containing protein n=1 Tax=Skermanella stibiiresistens SB22 TaxID=1385369 RepID=W9GWG8_9PROT|nr:PRC-barrel domain-containing protein [Skermanella stibiiresistens]EWY36792.1 hypothetical protein N825_25495 [Skermanella stibiiresistens SB22]
MSYRTTLMAAAVALMIPAAAIAQTAANPQGLSKVDDDRTDLTWRGHTIDKLEDMDLYNSAGDEIGEVEDVLIDATGQLSAVSVEFGGTLGIGDQEVVVPLDRLQVGENGRLTTDMAEGELSQLPKWDD